MRAPFEVGRMRTKAAWLVLPAFALTLAVAARGAASENLKQEDGLDAGRQAYESGDYAIALQFLREAAAKSPQNGEVQLLLAKTYYETDQHDAAIASAEHAVQIEPQNSLFHEWLGRA